MDCRYVLQGPARAWAGLPGAAAAQGASRLPCRRCATSKMAPPAATAAPIRLAIASIFFLCIPMRRSLGCWGGAGMQGCRPPDGTAASPRRHPQQVCPTLCPSSPGLPRLLTCSMLQCEDWGGRSKPGLVPHTCRSCPGHPYSLWSAPELPCDSSTRKPLAIAALERCCSRDKLQPRHRSAVATSKRKQGIVDSITHAWNRNWRMTRQDSSEDGERAGPGTWLLQCR